MIGGNDSNYTEENGKPGDLPETSIFYELEKFGETDHVMLEDATEIGLKQPRRKIENSILENEPDNIFAVCLGAGLTLEILHDTQYAVTPENIGLDSLTLLDPLYGMEGPYEVLELDLSLSEEDYNTVVLETFTEEYPHPYESLKGDFWHVGLNADHYFEDQTDIALLQRILSEAVFPRQINNEPFPTEIETGSRYPYRDIDGVHVIIDYKLDPDKLVYGDYDGLMVPKPEVRNYFDIINHPETLKAP